MQLKNKIKKIGNILNRYFLMPFLVSISSLLVFISILKLKVFNIDYSTILYTGLILGFITFFLWFKKIKEENYIKKDILEFCSPLFLMSLLFIIIYNFNHFYYLDFYSEQATYVFIFTLFFSGFIIFYEKKDIFEKIINNNINNDLQKEKIRFDKFKNKFPKIKNFFWGRCLNWFYKEGLLYSIGLIIIIAIGLYLRLNHVSSLFFWTDEANTITVAKRIVEGYGQTWISGIFYPRGLIYHHYLAFIIKYINGNIYYVSRFANIPFFIIIIITIYFFCKHILNKKLGILSTILFSLSWLSISIFREARFYEMWMAFFLIFIFLVYILIEKLIKKYKHNLRLLYFIKKEKLLLVLILVSGIVSYDNQQLTVIILYPLIIFSCFIFLFKDKIKGMYVFIFSFITLITGLFYAYGFSAFNNFIYQKAPEWKMLYPNTQILEFWKYLLNNDYIYLNIAIIIITIITIVFRKRLEILFLSSFLFVWYFFIAYQGYEVSMMRYYYPILPILVILISYSLIIIYNLFNTKINNILVFTISIILIIFSFHSAIQESNSIITNSSKNYFKNDNFKQELLFLRSNINIESSIIITNNISALPYYLFFNKTPDYIIIDNSIIPFDEKKIDPLTNKKEISYFDIKNIKNNESKYIYVIFNYPSMRVSLESFTEINKLGHEIFKNKNTRIYKIN